MLGYMSVFWVRDWQAYADDESNFGLQVADPDWILETALSADEANLQVRLYEYIFARTYHCF